MPGVKPQAVNCAMSSFSSSHSLTAWRRYPCPRRARTRRPESRAPRRCRSRSRNGSFFHHISTLTAKRCAASFPGSRCRPRLPALRTARWPRRRRRPVRIREKCVVRCSCVRLQACLFSSWSALLRTSESIIPARAGSHGRNQLKSHRTVVFQDTWAKETVVMNRLNELNCPKCNWRVQCSPASALDWLRQAKMVRRDTAPEPDLLGELLRAAGPRLCCPKCGGLGLDVRPADGENDEDWGMARTCQACGKPIARERLEVFPDVQLCIACQSSDDRGEPTGPAEYCPRCGNVMQLTRSRSPGVTRYVLTCPKCRR